MKTKEEITEWMHAQNWWPKFAMNCTRKSPRELIDDYWRRGQVIMHAFDWSSTAEGATFWSIRHHELEDFYAGR